MIKKTDLLKRKACLREQELRREEKNIPRVFPSNGVFSERFDRQCLDILEAALGSTPAYSSWKKFDPGSGFSVDERYAALPSLTKKDIRENFPGGLLPKGKSLEHGLQSGDIEFVKTSGTTDDSVMNIWHQPWWNASEESSWKLNSHAAKAATGNHREAILTSPLCVGVMCEAGTLPMEKRMLGRFLFLNERADPGSWTPEYMDRMIQEVGMFRPSVLEANPSLLTRLARHAAANGRKIFQPELVVLTYELPSQIHYREIRRAFAAPVVSSYGTTETGYVFMECEKGNFHQNTGFCRVDFQPLKEEHGGPDVGRILVTTFHNPWSLIVRFDVGDLARVSREAPCGCGRNDGLTLSAIEGRFKNITLTTEGKAVTGRQFDLLMSSIDGILEYKLVQSDRQTYRLQLVAETEKHPQVLREAEKALKKRYGESAKAVISLETALLPESSGKYRLTQTLFPLKIEDFLDECYLPEKL